jgi:thioredoxin-dependent peroxiredoxin
VVLGASFDTTADNLAFALAQEFPFSLLSDPDHSVGAAYEVVRAPDHQYANFPERHSYLIDPAGVIRKSYAVSDVAGHAAHVLADLIALQSTEP